jgi:hypothetical protein
MDANEYYRLRAVCLTMAQQSKSADHCARWVAMAHACADSEIKPTIIRQRRTGPDFCDRWHARQMTQAV